MPMCLILGCSYRSGRNKGIGMFRVPAIAVNQGEEAEELSRERRRLWLSAISRNGLSEKILNNDRVCENHFVNKKPATAWDRHNVDWVPSVALGHNKPCGNEEEAKAKAGENMARAERSKERRKRRSEMLEQERLQKLQRLNETGIPLEDISFDSGSLETEIVTHEQPEELTEEQTHGLKSCASQTEAFDYFVFSF